MKKLLLASTLALSAMTATVIVPSTEQSTVAQAKTSAQTELQHIKKYAKQGSIPKLKKLKLKQSIATTKKQYGSKVKRYRDGDLYGQVAYTINGQQLNFYNGKLDVIVGTFSKKPTLAAIQKVYGKATLTLDGKNSQQFTSYNVGKYVVTFTVNTYNKVKQTTTFDGFSVRLR